MDDHERRARVMAFTNPHSERGQYWLDNWGEFEIYEAKAYIQECKFKIEFHEGVLLRMQVRLQELQTRNEKKPQMVLSQETTQ